MRLPQHGQLCVQSAVPKIPDGHPLGNTVEKTDRNTKYIHIVTIHARPHTHTHKYIYIHLYIDTNQCTHIHIHTLTHIYTHTDAHAHTHKHRCPYTYTTHTHTQTQMHTHICSSPFQLSEYLNQHRPHS